MKLVHKILIVSIVFILIGSFILGFLPHALFVLGVFGVIMGPLASEL